MAVDVGTLLINIEGRLDDLEAALDKAERATRQAAQKMDNIKVNPFGGLVEAGAKVVASMGAVELASGSMQAVFDALNGDLEAFDARMRSLPAGIGPAFAAISGMIDSLFGFSRSIKKSMEESTKAVQAFRMEAERLDRVGKKLDSAADLRSEVEFRRKLLSAQTPEQREMLKLIRDQDKEFSKAFSLQFDPDLTKEQAEEARQLANRLLQTQLEERKRFKESMNAADLEADKNLREKTMENYKAKLEEEKQLAIKSKMERDAAILDQNLKRIREEKMQEEKERRLRFELGQAGMESGSAEAQINQISETFRRRIQQSTSEEERRLLRAIRNQQQANVIAGLTERAKSALNTANQDIQNIKDKQVVGQFQQVVLSRLALGGAGTPSDPVLKVQNDQKKILEQIRDNTKNQTARLG